MAGLNIAVVGGGINGICVAWQLAEHGHKVTLYEKNQPMSGTSSASTKLLHGGLRYLENGEIRLVHEALRERAWWVNKAPHLAHRLALLLPVYENSTRPRWQWKLGLSIYDLLAGRQNLGNHRWLDASTIRQLAPNLSSQGLKGGYRFYDGQMDDRALGLWAVEQAKKQGVEVRENSPVLRVTPEGVLWTNQGLTPYDRIVNAAGPWAGQLLSQSKLESAYHLDLVRGSHLILNGEPPALGFLLETGEDQRIFFVLPYQNKTLVGTTEVRQELDEPVVCSDEETQYLLRAYNRHFQDTRTEADIVSRFAGIRPLIRSANNPSQATREYKLLRHGQLLSVFGGKWTTARALAVQVADKIEPPG